MSDMKGNPHFGNANWTADSSGNETEALAANAFATLALAYEQRTATLVHFLDHLCRLKAYEEAAEINDIVLKRLGLRDV